MPACQTCTNAIATTAYFFNTYTYYKTNKILNFSLGLEIQQFMFTEGEITHFVANSKIREATESLYKAFKEKEAPYLSVEIQDFLSLMLMTPQVGKALADGKISFAEEIALQKKARKLSKGGYFFSKDPVADAMKYVIKSYYQWEDQFCEYLKSIFKELLDVSKLDFLNDASLSYPEKVMKAPYLYVRFVSSFFLNKDEDILSPGKIRKSEWLKIKTIGEKLALNENVFFDEFMAQFKQV